MKTDTFPLCVFTLPTFDESNQSYDDVGTGVELGGQQDTVVDLIDPLHLLQTGNGQLERQESTQLVDKVEWRVVDEVPATGRGYQCMNAHSCSVLMIAGRLLTRTPTWNQSSDGYFVL